MGITAWTTLFVGLSFALYVGIAIATRVKSTKGFYVAGHGVPALANGMATAADWMSAASFISMAGLISFMGYTGAMYLLGWTGGYVLLALLLAPYLRKFGKFTVPDFVGDRYYSDAARLVAVFCAVFVSFTYVAGQMRGVGVVFSRFLQVDITSGVVIGMAIVLVYATLGGMKGITWTQVAQYCVLIVAFLIPAVAISFQMTGQPVPQLGMGSAVASGPNAGTTMLQLIDELHRDLGFPEYTAAWVGGKKSMIDVTAITLALMAGTAGLPHVIIRFYTVKDVRAARWSAFWALLFISLLYTSAPAVAVFARVNLIETVHETAYEDLPEWFGNWEQSGLVAWVDKDGDGAIDYGPGEAFDGKPEFTGETTTHGSRVLANQPTDSVNELYVDRDIMVLANPEIAKLPAWVVGLVAAGGLAAALSTAAGLLLVISSAVAHDLGKRMLYKDMDDRTELWVARGSAAVAVLIAGYLGIHPPGFVAQVVAFAFGLAASSFFPVIVLGVFSKRVTKEAGITGMLSGIGFTAAYIIFFKFIDPASNTPENWLFGISPEGIGAVGMFVNLGVMAIVTPLTPPPPQHVQDAVEAIRSPLVEQLDPNAPAVLDH